MSQQAYILQNAEGTYAVVSNGGQAIRVTPCETIDDVSSYLVKSQRTPVRDLPPYFSRDDSGFKPISDYDFAVLNTLVTQEEADAIIEKDESSGFLSGIGGKFPALMAILHIGK